MRKKFRLWLNRKVHSLLGGHRLLTPLEGAALLNLDPRVLEWWRKTRTNLPFIQLQEAEEARYPLGGIERFLRQAFKSRYYERAPLWIQESLQKASRGLHALFTFPKLMAYIDQKFPLLLPISCPMHFSLKEKDWIYTPPEEEEDED